MGTLRWAIDAQIQVLGSGLWVGGTLVYVLESKRFSGI